MSVLARISITILLIRIFGSKQWLKWYLIIFTAISTVAILVYLINVYAQVSPIQGLWDYRIPARRNDPRIGQDMEYLAQCQWSLCALL